VIALRKPFAVYAITRHGIKIATTLTAGLPGADLYVSERLFEAAPPGALPLSLPILLFGARAAELAVKGDSFSAPLYLVGAFAVLGITLAPLAAAAAVRISLE
jgi:heme exporter protein CcmB